MKGGSSGFPDNTTYPRKPEPRVVFGRDGIILSLPLDSSDPRLKMVEDFHDLNIKRHEALDESGKDRRRVGSGNLSTAY